MFTYTGLVIKIVFPEVNGEDTAKEKFSNACTSNKEASALARPPDALDNVS
jgi:hypothetical protein